MRDHNLLCTETQVLFIRYGMPSIYALLPKINDIKTIKILCYIIYIAKIRCGPVYVRYLCITMKVVLKT